MPARPSRARRSPRRHAATCTPAAPAWEVREGDCRDLLRTLPDESVQTVITSPPYYGLRDYQADDQLGLEATPDEYVARLVRIFREVRRVLRPDGTLWLNLGDCYSRDGETPARSGSMLDAYAHPRGIPPKSLMGIPWRVALALQADGWFLRQDIIWSKPNPMPASVTDRCVTSHEYVFLFSKSKRYFFDHIAIREEAVTGKWAAMPPIGGKKHVADHGGDDSPYSGRRPPGDGRRNKRSVWTISTRGYKGSHVAVYPEALVLPCLLAGTSEKGACAECGTPLKRLTGRPCRRCSAFVPTQGKVCGACGYRNTAWRAERTSKLEHLTHLGRGAVGRHVGRRRDLTTNLVTNGWAKACECHTTATTPCLVLDPFTGSGTTGAVAARHGRAFVGIELNAGYAAEARTRIAKEAPAGTALTFLSAKAAPVASRSARGARGARKVRVT